MYLTHFGLRRKPFDNGAVSRKPTREGTEEMDSGKGIDWLIKNRSDRKYCAG
jgi:hypothetical protein